MKKILTLPTVIVFLLTILFAGGCQNDTEQSALPAVENGSITVTIYMKAKKIDGEKHLRMYNSYDRDKKVDDKLVTEVPPGATVIWKRTWFSGIKKIEKIGSKSGEGNIFKEDAKQIPNSKTFKIEIPADASPGEEEEYDIDFLDRGDNPHSIDPYIRIRPAS